MLRIRFTTKPSAYIRKQCFVCRDEFKTHPGGNAELVLVDERRDIFLGHLCSNCLGRDSEDIRKIFLDYATDYRELSEEQIEAETSLAEVTAKVEEFEAMIQAEMEGLGETL